MKEKINLFVDMDGCLCEWKDACVEELYEKDYFRNLKPYRNVVEAVKMAMKHPRIEVFILSAYLPDSEFALAEKQSWLDEMFGPELDAGHRLFVSTRESKCKAVNRPLVKNDILLDDYSHNLVQWQNAGGTGVKLINHINGKGQVWQYSRCYQDDEPGRILHSILQAAGQGSYWNRQEFKAMVESEKHALWMETEALMNIHVESKDSMDCSNRTRIDFYIPLPDDVQTILGLRLDEDGASVNLYAGYDALKDSFFLEGFLYGGLDEDFQFPIQLNPEQESIFESQMMESCRKTYGATPMELWKKSAVEMLDEKLYENNLDFNSALEKKSVKDAIEAAYEKVMKDDICLCFEEPEVISLYFSRAQLCYLLGLENPLDFLYNQLFDNDFSYMEELRNTITGFYVDQT